MSSKLENSRKLATIFLLLLTPFLMAFSMSFLLPTPINPWISLLQTTTLTMACATSAAAGICAWTFIHKEVQDIQNWERLEAIQVGR